MHEHVERSINLCGDLTDHIVLKKFSHGFHATHYSSIAHVSLETWYSLFHILAIKTNYLADQVFFIFFLILLKFSDWLQLVLVARL